MKPSDVSILSDIAQMQPTQDRTVLLANIGAVVAKHEPSEPAPARRFREAVQALETRLAPPGHVAMDVFTSPISELVYTRLPELLHRLAASQESHATPLPPFPSSPPPPPLPPAPPPLPPAPPAEATKSVRRKAAATPRTQEGTETAPPPPPPPPSAPPPPSSPVHVSSLPPPSPLAQDAQGEEAWGVDSAAPAPSLPPSAPPPKQKRAAKTNDEMHSMLCELMAAVHASYALLARAALDPSFTPPETLPPPSSLFVREPRS